MFQSERLAAVGLASRRRPNGLVASVMWLGGLVAAVAVIALFAGVLVFLVGLVMRARRNLTPRRRAGDGDVIEARKVDGAWVAYGWERDGR